MQGPSQDYVRGAGPFSQLESDYSVALAKLGAMDLSWGGLPGPLLKFGY